jgi:UDP-N-acetylmuramate: L-alanyl-gamma-D-glutamyl-meso-diaminopimelate ligase
MGAFAGLLCSAGHRVTGSDAAFHAPMGDVLAAWGIETRTGYDPRHLEPAPDLVIVGNAIPRGNPEVEHVLDHRIPYRSLPAVLEEMFLPGHNSIVVSGTHGKTTTTSLPAWLFEVAARRPSFLVGGVAENFGRSYQLAGGPDFQPCCPVWLMPPCASTWP